MRPESWPVRLERERKRRLVAGTREEEREGERERTSSEQVQLGMSGKNPEPIILPPKRLHRRPLAHIPDPNRLILRIRDDQLMLRMEQSDGNIVKVTSAGIDLPRLGFGHPPKLDLTIVTARDDERESRVEGRPVDSAVVAFEDVFDHGVGVAEEVGLARVGALYLLLEGERLGGGVLLAKTC